jgi:squalene synthase HpnC
MVTASELRSGKGHRDENFPVASLLKEQHRAPVLAFYDFVRTADDIADHTTLGEAEKLAHLDRLEQTLLGQHDDEPVGVTLRTILSERRLTARHAQDLLTAFRLDVTKRRYPNWEELIDYCRYSAMPVGRYVLDVHGESRAAWPANDALCAALQIINHLQDCKKDYLGIDRVYVPLDALVAAGLSVEALGAARATPALRTCLAGLARRTAGLLRESGVFSSLINDTRLALEVAAIQALAERLTAILQVRDPLSERVHLGKGGMVLTGLAGVAKALIVRPFRKPVAAASVARP